MSESNAYFLACLLCAGMGFGVGMIVGAVVSDIIRKKMK